RLYYLSLVLSVLHYRFCLSSLSLLFCLFRFVFSLCSSCSCLFRCLSDSIPPRSIFASLELLLPSCCCSFPFPRVHLSKSLANSWRFLLTSFLSFLNFISFFSCFFLLFLFFCLFPRVHLSKSLANSRRFLLTSCLACSKLIACCSWVCPIFLESDSIDCVSWLLSPFPRSCEL